MDCPEGRPLRLLVLFIHNHLGGAMTALVNFVNALDPARYQVDLLFYELKGQVEGIRPEVRILPPACSRGHLLAKALSPAYLSNYLRAQYYLRAKGDRLLARQLRAQQGCRFSRRLEGEYDLAVAFELAWPFYYMMGSVRAKRKLVWHHNDYQAIGYRFDWDRPYFDRVDGLVFVSRECMEKFTALHPGYREKCFFMPNLMAAAPILARAAAGQPQLPFALARPGLNLVTVARVSFASKGLDRMVGVLTRLREEGLLDRVRWLVIGGGHDLPRFRQMLAENGLEGQVQAIGPRENPLPYLPAFDAFLLPSRNEGKPVAVTEAQILGLPPVVTRYTSAFGQIEDGVDGFIFENNDEALYQGLRELLLHPEKLAAARRAVQARSYTNEQEIARFHRIVRQVLGGGEGGG
ncbi:MAG TPA: glycosyltransferase [Candidatus Anaerotruncus excrementipullorum]|uniref:Glycosyltransferase n=1 Tax=Candidatus Anaerotruncus excrementipullorum TaxID=2838465 RepID=A0A9D1WR67_9FIRM|nr:glycosyltransferase [Candidatus Anaerotruncus excrementipullorum]